jgi:broad specificity phosphatase PhoE
MRKCRAWEGWFAKPGAAGELLGHRESDTWNCAETGALPMSTIFLFRHGETDMTHGRYCGSSDPPLNERGREQAERICDLLRSETIAAIYASPLRRALETAEPSARALGLEIIPVSALREADFGAWEGMTFDEVRRLYPAQWSAREADPYSVAPPGGESYRDLLARIEPAFEDLLGSHGDATIAVFAHRSVNRLFMTRVFSMPVAHYRRIQCDPAALTVIKSHNERVEILKINERCHLGATAGDIARGLSDNAEAGEESFWKR